MPRPSFDFVAGGADDEVTLRDNVEAWTRIRLRPRVLQDVSTVDTSTTVLGTAVSVPVLLAPTAYQRLAHENGECASSAGAAAAGTLMVLSTRSSCTIEDVAGAAPDAPRWFQVYVLRDRGWTGELVDRATASGYRALVLTLDTPVLGFRRRDERGGFRLPAGVGMANVVADIGVGQAGGEAVAEAEAFLRSYQAADLGPADVEWLAQRSPLPIVAKGVLTAEAARLCVDSGAAAIVVSNHGGRQLDGVVATADALAEVIDAVGSAAEVYVDGGIRRGTDVLKALALGARATLIGRPAVWGLATAGADGVRAVVGHLEAELGLAMALAGTPTVADIDIGLVRRPLP
ncbi:MAG TPA: alpha-hydroxy acid oxidase [Acidimicrobiales bacterium]|nr:alpha-hydroxy acid oxidase [Acidimicrobiales bacterium]